MDADTQPLFLVLELDEPAASRITELRTACRDAFRASLPAEITVTGSSGVGVLVPGQAIEEIAGVMQEVAQGFAPVQACFGPVMRFPDTNIFAFTMTDEAPFRALHHQFVTSTLKFERSAFPFKPHCTISSIPVTEEEATRRLRYRWSEAFSLSTLALYGLRGGQVTRLATVSLPC